MFSLLLLVVLATAPRCYQGPHIAGPGGSISGAAHQASVQTSRAPENSETTLSVLDIFL